MLARALAFLLGIVASILVGQPASSEPGDIVLELMASPAGFSAGASPGHAFMCIALHLNSGIKEDCFGFYPKTVSLEMFVGGPGLIDNEFERNPARFGVIAESLKKNITSAQRGRILAATNDFNRRKYQFTENNCIDFVNTIVQAAGLSTPPRSATQTPAEYLRELKTLNP